MINTLFQIGGITYTPKNLNVNIAMSEFGVSSNFIAEFDNPFGRHSTDFTIGQEVVIYADKDIDPAVTKIFTGILESREFEGEENTQVLVLRGRDYTARLMDVTVEPVVYTNSEISTIVTNIIDNEVQDVTTTNVDVTTTTLPRIAFNHQSVYDALTQLAELAGFVFYIDVDKDLHFEERNTISSNQIFDNTNISSSQFDTDREDFANIIWVYGDRQLTTAPQFVFIQDANLGSVLTLPYRPHNTQVRSSEFFAGSILVGGVFNMVAPSSVSGLEYLVNFEDRQIILVSGTTPGYSRIPPDGGSIVVNYERDVPIVKFGQNNASITAFGPKEKVILDKTIKDPLTAKNILLSEMENSLPLDRIELKVDGWFNLIPSQTAIVNIPNFNLSGNTVGILEVNYDFNPVTIRSEEVINITLDNKILSIEDKFIELNRRLIKLEAGDTSSTDLITRFEFSTGSVLVVGSKWLVNVGSMTGSGYHLWSTNFTPPINPFYLSGTSFMGRLSGSYTGSAVAITFSLKTSGGYIS